MWTIASVAIFVTGYIFVAYVVLPFVLKHFEHQPGLQGRPMSTVTAQGIPGDPLNIGLVGSKADIVKAMKLAGWYPADAITMKTSIEIVESVMFDRPYPEAPVSNLFYDGRHQDLAFEKPAGHSADQRHHVRFWMALKQGLEGRPVWLGAATFDRGIGFNRYTAQLTHHIAPDVDAERDVLISDLSNAGVLARIYQVSGIGPAINRRNGGGDRYFTDGEITVGEIRPNALPTGGLPDLTPSPAPVRLKDAIWTFFKTILTPPRALK